MFSFVIAFTTRRPLLIVLLFGSILIVLISLISCKTQQTEPSSRYHLQGSVVSVDRSHGELVVKHGDIPRLMQAMTMRFKVAGAQSLEKVSPGDEIRADLVREGGAMRLENITVLNKQVAP